MTELNPARDTGDLLEVPVDQQLDVDDPSPDALAVDTALTGGADDDLTDVYANPTGHA